MSRIWSLARTVRAERPLITAVIVFGIWCALAPTAWTIFSNVAAQPEGPKTLFYLATGGLLIMRIVRAAGSPVQVEESYPVRTRTHPFVCQNPDSANR